MQLSQKSSLNWMIVLLPFFQDLHLEIVRSWKQSFVLKEMDEGSGLTAEAVKELRRATDLVLRATNHMACASGRSMVGLIASVVASQ